VFRIDLQRFGVLLEGAVHVTHPAERMADFVPGVSAARIALRERRHAGHDLFPVLGLDRCHR
jgi:hypothetical protein